MLETLPAELLLEIHLLSTSSSLPSASRYFCALFSSTSKYHRAAYLLERHPSSTLSRAIRYPICTLPVIRVLESLAQRRGKRLRCSELPRRLVKGLASASSTISSCLPSPPSSPPPPDSARDVDLELISYLLTTYSASPNSKAGYFLARAVLARHLPLIRLLLEHGADPSLKGGWAVMAAIQARDLGLVKMLLEREIAPAEATPEDEDADGVVIGRKRRRSSLDGGRGKRIKMDTLRTPATSEMLTTAVALSDPPEKALVDYLIEKGAKPSLETLREMMRWE